MIPSWSWASRRTPVRWKDLNDRDHGKDYTAEYIACDIVPADVSDPLGAITGKQLTLRGNVRMALWNGLELMTHDVSQAGRKLASRQRSQSPTGRLADASQRGGGGDTKRKPVLATSSYRRRDPPLSRLTVDVTWDCLLEPDYQRVKLLELRCTFIKPVYYSFGIILTYNRRGTSER